MEIDQSEKENTQLESVGIPTDLAMEESEAKPAYHNSPSKNGNDIASPTNGVTTLDVSNSKLNTPNPGTNGVRLSYKIDDYIPPSSKSTHDLRNSFISSLRMWSRVPFVSKPSVACKKYGHCTFHSSSPEPVHITASFANNHKPVIT